MSGGVFYRAQAFFPGQNQGLAEWAMGKVRFRMVALSVFLGCALFLLIPAGKESFPGLEAKRELPAGNPPAPAKATPDQGYWSCLLNRLALSGDWKCLAVAGPGGTVCLWDLESARVVGQVDVGPLPVTFLAMSPDGKLLGWADSNSEIKIIDIDYKNLLQEGRLEWNGPLLGRHEGPVTSLAFSPDGTTLLSSGMEKTVQLWDVRSGEHLHTWRAGESLQQTTQLWPVWFWMGWLVRSHL